MIEKFKKLNDLESQASKLREEIIKELNKIIVKAFPELGFMPWYYDEGPGIYLVERSNHEKGKLLLFDRYFDKSEEEFDKYFDDIDKDIIIDMSDWVDKYFKNKNKFIDIHVIENLYVYKDKVDEFKKLWEDTFKDL